MTGCVIAVLAAALLAYLLASSWSRPSGGTTDAGAAPRATIGATVVEFLKIGALLALVIIVFAIMAVSLTHTRPHR